MSTTEALSATPAGETVKAACEANTWKFSNALVAEKPAFSLVFEEHIGGASLLLIVPQTAVQAVDMLFRPRIAAAEWRGVPETRLTEFANLVTPPPQGALEVVDGALTVVFKNIPAVSAEAVAEAVKEHAIQYSKFHMPISSLVLRGLSPAAAAAVMEGGPTSAGAANAHAVECIKEATQGLGLQFSELTSQDGIQFGLNSDTGSLDVSIRTRDPIATPLGYATPVDVRTHYRDPCPAERRSELALALVLANYGLPIGHFDGSPADGSTCFGCEVLLEPTLSVDTMQSMVAEGLRLAVQAAERYRVVFEAVNAGSSATDAIKLVEPEVEVPSEVSQAPPSAAAEPPSGGAGSEGAEPGVSPFVRSALERLQAALQGAGPIAAIRGAHIAKSSEAVHVRQALIAALDAIGISRYREDEEGAQGPASGPRTIAFGLEFEPGQRVMVEVRYLATTRETGGPRLLIRAFDLDAGKVPEAALDAVAEFVARANFGLNYGFFDVDPSERIPAFNAQVRLSVREVTEPETMKAIFGAALTCVFNTHKQYMPGFRLLLDPATGAEDLTAVAALGRIEGEDASFDLAAEIARAAAAGQPEQSQ